MPSELLLIAAAAVLALGATILIRTRNAGRTPAEQPGRRLTRDELDTRLQDLIGRKQLIHAIKLLRQQTGMGLREAKDAVDGLAAGRPISHPAYQALGPALPDLATRARRLKQAGHRDRAARLVAEETGMSPQDAVAFVDIL